MHSELDRFDPTVPVERAATPPASWYVEAAFHELERASVFRGTWQAVGPLSQLARPGDYVSGAIAGEPYLVVHGKDGSLRAFYNVCRHHASCIVEGAGTAEQLVCPYHGWTYDLDGRLRKAPKMGGIREFDREQFGLVPLEVATWGPLVFVRQSAGGETLDQLLAPLEGRLECDSLRFVTRKSYEIECNWKVFVDNYLDGGYHVSHLHRGLAGQLDLDSYRTEIAGKVSLQTCSAATDAAAEDGADFRERVGSGAVYAHVYPNFMINRYGPVMDTNWVAPLGAGRTLTVFDYYFDATVDAGSRFIEDSLAASDRVQQEDIAICESVQRGLGSSAYDTGRYAPTLEHAAHHFHRLLTADLRSGVRNP